jgi:hypothetical protein
MYQNVRVPIFICWNITQYQPKKMWHKIKICTKNMEFWDVIPHNLVDRYQHFERSCSLHLLDRRVTPTLLPWRWRQQVPLKFWYLSTKLHSITFQKTIILILTTMRTSNIRICTDYTNLTRKDRLQLPDSG